jgi:acyl-CoA synthetase (NDP forming)
VVACTADTPEVDRRLRAAGIPIFPTPERAVRAYRMLRAQATGGGRPAPARRPPRTVSGPLAGVLARSRGPLAPGLARALLEHYGVAFPPEGVAASAEEARSVASRIGYPVVVKTASPGLFHKTDAGGVVLDVGDEAALRQACAGLAARFGAGAGFVVQRRVPAGVELLVGGRRDPVFGPTVVAGLGGVLTELWRDVALRLAPLDEAEARGMLREGRKAALIAGFRGAPPCDERPLVAALVGIGDLLVDHPEIVELDVNPLIAHGAQAVAVDALVIVDRTP